MAGRKKKSEDRPNCGAICPKCRVKCECKLYQGHPGDHFSYKGMGGCGHQWPQ